MKRLLVANRGEIAVRILSAARELDITAIALYTDDDTGHIQHANEAVQLPSASHFTNIDHLVSLCQKHNVDAVHPGYGFLSESPSFVRALERSSIQFIGPTASILEATGDKLSARKLAEDARVPVLPALREPTTEPAMVREFAGRKGVGWPVMLKAVDGGGGRGIRLVREEEELEAMFQRAQAESPSRSIFAEKALVEGCRHIEVQIIGDGEQVMHVWERECSIQRRYQKIVEIAPSTLRNQDYEDLVAAVIEAAVHIASHIRYNSLGTFEFLVDPASREFYFMEINPRLQVEHTITEATASLDLVSLQLMIANGGKLESLKKVANLPSPEQKPQKFSIQLRVTAEDPRRDFALSIGRINNISFPGGNGIRIDSHLEQGSIVSADFDSLLAKVIVTAPDYELATRKGIRALDDLRIEGITTNQSLLKGILLSEVFQKAACDTKWLENNLQAAIEAGTAHERNRRRPAVASRSKAQPSVPTGAGGGLNVKKGDSWNVTVSSGDGEADFGQTVQVSKLMRNDLPHSFAAEISGKDGTAFTVRLSQADASSSGMDNTSSKRKADPRNAAHLVCPLSGQLVEVLVDEGDEVNEFDPVAIIRQMKMELEVRAHKKGVIQGLWDVEDGDNVESGMLVCVITDDSRPREKL